MTENSLPDTGYMRLKQVLRFIPVSKSDWWAGVKSGVYPPSYKLGARKTAWRAEDIKTLMGSFEQNKADVLKE
jgi:prophage regulatory protein